MKKPFTLLILLFVSTMSFAQGISKADLKVLKQKEDSLKVYATKIIQGINADNRFNADSMLFPRQCIPHFHLATGDQ
jgi:outer membrane lipoprotein-sorting protein